MDELIHTLLKVLEAKRSHDNAREAYDGYNWDWHGYNETTALNSATDNLKDALKDVVRDVVREELETE